MNKIYVILILLFSYISFCLFVNLKKSENMVMGIIDATKFQVDINSNGRIDDDEVVCIPHIKTFSLNMFDDTLARVMNLSIKDSVAMGYLTEEYSKELLYLRPVRVKFDGNKNHNCRYGEIFIGDEKYSDKLYAEGFAAKNGALNQSAYNEKLIKAKKINPVLLNLKSLKYHQLDCEYGVKSSNYTIIPKKHLPKEATPCNFCSVKKRISKIDYKEQIPDNIITDGNVKLILTDFTKNLKPNRRCDVEPCLSLLNLINSANKSIDFAVYGWDNVPLISEALANAQMRGVFVRVVYDGTTSNEHYYAETSDLVDSADIAISDIDLLSNTSTNKLMHNKFIIFDNRIVMTGSMNISETGLSGYNSDAVVIIEAENLANLYTAEFEQMIAGNFHKDKVATGLENYFDYENSKIFAYFSPYDNIIDKIISYVDVAQNYIYIPAFLITHKDLTEALINAKSRNVDVKVILDATNASNNISKQKLLKNGGISLKIENYAGKLHSKSIIIDDKYVVTGSMNFSKSGNDYNDENVLIIENDNLAKAYKNFFEYLWNLISDEWSNKNPGAESTNSIGSCTDGIDNDFDGLVDSEDNGCKTDSKNEI